MAKLSRPYAHGRPFLNTEIHLTIVSTNYDLTVHRQLNCSLQY